LPEDIVEHAVAEGVGQYVILGAGLDSFAYRRRDLLERLRVYEVDHPETQAWKRERLTQLDIDIHPGLVFAPVDFERQTLADGLSAAGFDFDAPATFSWLGVTLYLTHVAIAATLDTIARCPAGSQVVVTYNLPRNALRGMGATIDAAVADIASGMGEPVVSLFLPDEIERVVRAHGFDDIVHFGPEEAHSRYFEGRSDVQFGGAQRVIVATVAPQSAGRTPRA
jgi:methyltransferase (TIGR00027 family)